MIEPSVERRSTTRSRLNAAMVPSATAAQKLIVTDTSDSVSDGPSFALSSSVTGLPLRMELPRSPCNTLPSQWMYWTTIGSSSPNRSRKACRASGVIFSVPNIASSTDPGSRRTIRNVTTDSTKRPTNAPPNRVKTVLLIGSAPPRQPR